MQFLSAICALHCELPLLTPLSLSLSLSLFLSISLSLPSLPPSPPSLPHLPPSPLRSCRDSQIPSFLTVDQARQILATGKSINFLRQVCRDDSAIRGIESLRATFDAINGTCAASVAPTHGGCRETCK